MASSIWKFCIVFLSGQTKSEFKLVDVEIDNTYTIELLNINSYT